MELRPARGAADVRRRPLADLHAFRRRPLPFLTELAAAGGDVAPLRLGPYRAVLVSHPDLVADVLVGEARRVRKSPVLRAARVVLGDGLLTSEGEVHRRQRRLVQPAFGPTRLDGYATTMSAAAREVVGGWAAGVAIDAHAAMLQLTVTAAARSLFGAQPPAGVVERAVDDLLAAYGSPLLPVARLAQWLPLPAFRRLRRGRAALDGLVSHVTTPGRTGGDAPLLETLAASGMPQRLLRDEVVTLLLAGHETTASMLAWTWWLLAGDPATQEAVAAEAAAVPEQPSRADLARMPVARGALAEALRLYPPSWAMGRQATADIDLGGWRVPAGTVLIASQWVVHRDPRWWPDPERFDPGRWVGPAGDRPRLAYFPFGAGPRMCVGEQFAWTEGLMALAVIARRWRLERAPGRAPALDPRITLRPADGVWLRAHPR